MLRKLFPFILCFFPVAFCYAQTGNISGSVKTSDGKPAELVSVSIKGTSKGAATDKNGTYFINEVLPGSYTIIASFIGLEKHEQTTEVKAAETAVVHFVLKENLTQLQEVTVSSTNVNKVTPFVA